MRLSEGVQGLILGLLFRSFSFFFYVQKDSWQVVRRVEEVGEEVWGYIYENLGWDYSEQVEGRWF